MSDEILSSIQWKAAIKEAAWPKCAAPRLVYDSALFFETCMDVYVRTTYDQIYSAKIKAPPEVRSRDGHTCRTCVQKFRSFSYKRRGNIGFSAENMRISGSCL